MVDPITQPRLEIVNQLVIACVLNKNEKSLPKKMVRLQVSILHEPQFSAINVISKFLHRHGAQKYTKYARRSQHPRRFPSEKKAEEGRTKLEVRRGANPTHTTTLFNPRNPFILSSKNHHLVNILQSCCEWAHFYIWKTSQEEKIEPAGLQYSVMAGSLPAQVLQLLTMWLQISY